MTMRIAVTPCGKLERAGAVFLRHHALIADLLDERLADDFLERQHGGQQRPGLGQHEAHGERVRRCRLAPAGRAGPGAGLVWPPILPASTRSKVNFTSSSGERRAVMEAHAVTQGEIIGERVRLRSRRVRFPARPAWRVAREQAVVHVADDGFGVAVAGIGGIERERVLREADADFGLPRRGRAAGRGGRGRQRAAGGGEKRWSRVEPACWRLPGSVPTNRFFFQPLSYAG